MFYLLQFLLINNKYLKYSFSQGNTWKNKKSRPEEIQAANRQKVTFCLTKQQGLH